MQELFPLQEGNWFLVNLEVITKAFNLHIISWLTCECSYVIKLSLTNYKKFTDHEKIICKLNFFAIDQKTSCLPKKEIIILKKSEMCTVYSFILFIAVFVYLSYYLLQYLYKNILIFSHLSGKMCPALTGV